MSKRNEREKSIDRFFAAASAPAAIKARISLVAQKRGLQRGDIKRALRASARLDSGKQTGVLVDFATAHDLSMDWLIKGDLRGLRRMKESGKPVC